ncbi:pyridoxal phosphate phosphatase PHOSPHO2-like [Prorops nasuta]|uniref:pyridoxal phosphate phosphatase PHOSPHO2-like n=1 Tax=Prorops nasuta TaxID=863751 RepID=UPI0034CDB41E
MHICYKACNLLLKSSINFRVNYFKSKMHKSFLIAFDFDHTIINDNVDIIARNLLPQEKLTKSVQDLYHADGWTSYMEKIFELLFVNGISIQEIKTAISNISPVSDLDTLLNGIYLQGYEAIIISDANSVFIDHWLKSKNLDHVFTKIFTNPAEITAEGLLKISRYHTQDWCKYSTVNLCKGHILENYIKKRNEKGKYFDHIAYVGDGKNDLCPILRLSEKDFAFPRINYELMKLLNKPKNDMLPIKAQTIPWNTGKDILKALDIQIKNV